MISKAAAGGGAAALTAFAIGVSLRHGMFVADLAFVGGFASPAIIGSETPNTPVLFGYLLAIAAGTLCGHSAPRVVAARLGRFGRLGDLDRGLDAVSGLWPALGRAVPGRGCRPVRLGDLATARRGRPGDRCRGAGLGDARGHGRADRGAHRAGWRQADRRLGRAGGTRHRALRPGAMDAALPVRRGAGAAPVARSARPVARHRRVRLDGDMVRRPLCRGFLRLAVERRSAGLLGGVVRRHGARALPARLVRAARRRRRHAVGPYEHRARAAVPGRRRASGALARQHGRAPPRRWAISQPASPSSSPSRSPSSCAANGSRWPMPWSSPPSRASPPISAFTPCAGCAGCCSPPWSCASCSIPRC